MNIADVLRERLEKLPGPRSLVEVGLGPDEIAALRAWAVTAHPLRLEAAPLPFALCFLASATVAAREHASEHALWPYVRAWFPSNKDTARLFVVNDLPIVALREAIERAARRYDLRHAFDRNEAEHRTYVTVLLQCGFTRPGLAKLPEWLAGRGAWRSIQLLLDDPVLASSTFRATFERLRELRLGWRDDVPPSPWLAGDMNRLAGEAARLSLSLGTSAAGPPPAPGVRLLEAPGGGLAFRVPLTLPPDVVARAHPHVELALNDQPGRRALRQPDGSYFAPPAEQVGLADTSGSGIIQLRILDPARIVLHEEDIELFAGDDDLDVFAPVGHGEYRRVADPWTDLVPAEGAILRVAEDLPVKGPFAAGPMRVAGSRWQRVQPGEMRSVEVGFGEDFVWTFLLEERMRWQGAIAIAGDERPWKPGTELGWTLRLTRPAARLRSARLGRHRLTVSPLGGETFRVTLPARPSLPVSFALRLRIEDGEQRFTVAWPAPPPACEHLFTRGEDGWRLARVDDLSCLSRPVRWFAGTVTDGDWPWLFEGRRPVLPLTDREVQLARPLAGLGAPLTVERRRFNSDAAARSLTSSLGGLRPLRLVEARDGRSTLVMPPDLTWRDEFQVAVLGDDGLTRDVVVEPPRDLAQIVLPGSAGVAAAAVIYRGESIASTISVHIDRAMSRAPDLGACVRWLMSAGAPIAATHARAALVRALRTQPLVAVTVALARCRGVAKSAFPATRPSVDESMHGFWRERVDEVMNEVESVLNGSGTSVVDLLLDPSLNPFAAPEVEGSGNAVTCAIARLGESDPVLAARVLRAACRSQDRTLARVLRDAKLELRNDLASTSLDGIARLLQVDDGFVSKHQQAAVAWALGDALPPERRENVRRLLYLPEFRRSVAADAIRRLTTEEPDARRRPGDR